MSERKVLNKYYPPDFDPAKIPRLKRPKVRQFAIRVMAPFNMRCNTCGEYIYKGKKFNSRQETVENKDYLGLRIYRFYIKCPTCVSEITFLTDPENCDYSVEGGASRNFEASKTAMKLAIAAQKEIEDEEANNPMKVLENRTKSSRQEMDMLETLQELKELNSSHARLDENEVIELHTRYKQQLELLQDQEDEKVVMDIFKVKTNDSIKRLPDELDEDIGDLLNPDLSAKVNRLACVELPNQDAISKAFNKERNPTNHKRKSLLNNLVKKKEPKIAKKDDYSGKATISNSEVFLVPKPPTYSTSANRSSSRTMSAVSTSLTNSAPSTSSSNGASTSSNGASTSSHGTSTSLNTPTTSSSPLPTGLAMGLISAYSDSSSDSN